MITRGFMEDLHKQAGSYAVALVLVRTAAGDYYQVPVVLPANLAAWGTLFAAAGHVVRDAVEQGPPTAY